MRSFAGNISPLRDSLAEEVARIFFGFLENFNPCFSLNVRKEEYLDYKRQIALMIKQDSKTVYIDFQHLIQYNDELADVIEEQYARLEPYLNESFFQFAKKYHCFFAFKEGQRKEFYVSFYNLPDVKNIRSLNSKNFGKLVSITGIVTRISTPFPEIVFGSFECTNEMCNYKIIRMEQRFHFSEPKICTNCGNVNSWNLLVENSVFSNFQRIRIQEIPTQKPFRNIPNSIEIFLKEDDVDLVKLGDRCIFSGTGIMLPFSNDIKNSHFVNYKEKIDLKKSKNEHFAEFIFRTKFIVSHVLLSNFYNKKIFKNFFRIRNSRKIDKSFSRNERELVLKLRSKKRLFKNLISYFKFDYEEMKILKISIFLMMIGGVEKIINNTEKIRGNINLLINGLTRFQKTKLFKSISTILPRTIFLNGIFSSQAGLIASVSWDPLLSCFSIEAGALVMANRGFCFLDNYDGLKRNDRVSLHDIIDQQFISLAKAGLRMNIKTKNSILALTSTFLDRKNSFLKISEKNISENLPDFYKFDIFLDREEKYRSCTDYKFVKSIISINSKNQKTYSRKINFFPIQLYISFAKNLKPSLNKNSKKLVLEIYIFLKKKNLLDSKKKDFMSLRKLENLIRLSESFAKIFLSSEVELFHVKAAARLLFFSSTIENNMLHKGYCEKKKNKFDIKKNELENFPKKMSISFGQFDMISDQISKLLSEKKIVKFRGMTMKKLVKFLFLNFKRKNNVEKDRDMMDKFFFTIKYMAFIQKLLIITFKKSKNLNKAYIILT